ncbi:MAG: tRNA (adenosine(37)-N6)-dimethylallyltransferase MiaA [Desulfosalsimonadaceae bacterium]
MGKDSTSKPKIVAICGPTGIGKTAISLALAEAFRGAVVSADSMQIYRYMDIGTAKPDAEEQLRVPHYMIDVADPDASYDAARYAKEGRECIAAIHRGQKLPFVTGGTGFYIKALLKGLFAARPSSPEIREELRRQADAEGSRALYDRLRACDPEAARRIHPNDAYRLIRALEVYQLTGRPISACQQAHGFDDTPFDAFKIGLHMEREALYARIDRRVEKMIGQGLLEEVRNLLKMGYTEDLKPMQAIGYRHMVDYIKARMSWEEAVELMKRDTRRYAKRQLVWFRRDRELVWAAPDARNELRTRIADFLAS